jgi:type 1 glutamine amidotransferase
MKRSAMMLSSLVVLCLAAAGPAQPFAEQAPPVKLLIITGDHGHAWKETTKNLAEFLAKGGAVDVAVTESPAKDLTDENLSKYDVLLLNYKETRPSPETKWTDANKAALVRAVKEGGKGLVVYHFASSAFTDWDEYEQMIAGGWRKQGFHGPRHVFDVKRAEAKHPVSEGMPASFTHANDELYSNSKITPGSVILATAYCDPAKPKGTGKDEPVIWVNQFGKGRVYHNALGHDVAAMDSPPFQEWMRRGALWAAGRDVEAAKP